MGIDKISEKIIADAKERAVAIQKDAEQKAADLIANGESLIKQKADAIINKAELEASDIERRQTATTDLEMRKRVLGAKRSAIEVVFDKAKDALPGMPEKEYAELMERLLINCASVGQGALTLSQRDGGSPAYVAAAEKKLAPVKFKIAGEASGISGGFIFRMDGMEIDCSLENLVQRCAGDLESGVSRILFET